MALEHDLTMQETKQHYGVEFYNDIVRHVFDFKGTPDPIDQFTRALDDVGPLGALALFLYECNQPAMDLPKMYALTLATAALCGVQPNWEYADEERAWADDYGTLLGLWHSDDVENSAKVDEVVVAIMLRMVYLAWLTEG